MLTRSLLRSWASARPAARSASSMAESFYDEDQKAVMKTARQIIDKEINPYVDQWEEEKV